MNPGNWQQSRIGRRQALRRIGVFGIGLPPFRGGPFRYMDAVGISIVVQRLEDLNTRFPGRFEPAELLLEMVRRRESFYGEART